MKKLSSNDAFNQYNSFLEKEALKSNKKAKLLTIRVGDDLGAISYEKSLIKHSKSIGVQIETIRLARNKSKNDIINIIENANKNDSTNGILVLQPIQGDYDKNDINMILESIIPDKDVDGATFFNFSKILKLQDYKNIPPTARAIHLFIKSEISDIKGINVLIINRSNVIGIPLFFLLEKEDATVTLAHSKSQKIDNLMKEKDIIISAVGKSEIFKPSELKEGCIIVDVGISQNQEGQYTGDFDLKALSDKNINYLPSIGGIGKLTRTIILENTLINYLGEEYGR